MAALRLAGRTWGQLWVLAFVVAGWQADAQEWSRLPSLPDRQGFAGSYAGVSNNALLVAGGANFPDKKPWDGGEKVWYDTVFVLQPPSQSWQVAGRLPRPLGYGVCVTHRDGVVCVGGSDAVRHYADTFRLAWNGDQLTTTELPSLPHPLANACGALVGDILYIAGGQDRPDTAVAQPSAWKLDLSAKVPAWAELPACPGRGRILATAAGYDHAFWLIGGAGLVVGDGDKVERQYLNDAYRYDPGKGWTRVADLPYPIVAAPSPAPTDAAGFYVLGGDDGSQVGVPPDQHSGFRKTVLHYEMKTGKWIEAGTVPASRVTTPCVQWNMRWVLPSGEVRPGVRSPEVWSFAPEGTP